MNPCHGSVLVQVGAWKCVLTLSSHTLHMHISAAGFLIEISWASPLPVASFSRNTKAGRGWRGWGTLAVKPKRPSETQIYSRNGNWATTMPLSSKMTLALKRGCKLICQQKPGREHAWWSRPGTGRKTEEWNPVSRSQGQLNSTIFPVGLVGSGR